MRAYWNLAVCTAEAGRWAEAIDHYRTAIDALPRLGLAHVVPELYAYAAQDLLTLGRWDEARALVDEAARRFPSRRDEATPIELPVATGAFTEARRLIAAASERDVFTDEEDYALVMVNLADLETWEGNTGAARTAADAADQARAGGRPDEVGRARIRAMAHQEQIRELLARPGPEGGWKREVRVLAAMGDGERTRLDGDADPAAWAAAVDASRELAMAYHPAYAQARHGEAIVAAGGERDRAADELLLAHGAARSFGALPLRELVERIARRARIPIGADPATGNAFGLTRREREVLDLVAQGASNRSIAAALFISEKTASVHVSNIIRKLSVSNRGEAASVAYRAGLVT